MDTLIFVLVVLALIILLVGLFTGRLGHIVLSFFDAITVDIHSKDPKLPQNKGVEEKHSEREYLDLKPSILPPPSDVGNVVGSGHPRSNFMSDEDMIRRIVEFEMNIETGDDFEIIDRTVKES